jgi:hypothetical protein
VVGIFNRAIFNDAIFNTAAAAAVTPERNAGGYGAFWAGHVKTKKERQEAIERIEAQIRGPQKKAVAKAIVKVADQALEREADAFREILVLELEAQSLRYQAQYLKLLREEVRRQREQDDEVALLMLMH